MDVGALGGVEREWEGIRDCIRVVGFEPDEREFQKLNSSESCQYFNKIVWSKSEDILFYMTQETGKSSVFVPNWKFLEQFPDAQRHQVVKTVKFDKTRVSSLDDLLRNHQIKYIDFLKVDTQGGELEVLKGADGFLKHTLLGLKVEVQFSELYKGRPTFLDIDKYLRDRGYEIIDLRRAFWKRKNYQNFKGKGQLIFADALYFKSLDSFYETLHSYDRVSSIQRMIKFVSTCLIYGMNDYAISILEKSEARDFMETAKCDELINMIKVHDKRIYPDSLPGSRFLSAFLRRVSFQFKKSHLGWSDGDEFVGNRSQWR